MPDNSRNHSHQAETADHERRTENNLVGAYLLFLFVALFFLSILHHLINMPNWYIDDLLLFQCGYIGALAGVLYCVIAFWRHHASRNWMKKWAFWFVFRPVGSAATGLISYLALKGGLLALSTSTATKPNTFYIYMVVAFIAGYKMVSFLTKIEDVILPANSKNKAKDVIAK